jgi:hypothetical protein
MATAAAILPRAAAVVGIMRAAATNRSSSRRTRPVALGVAVSVTVPVASQAPASTLRCGLRCLGGQLVIRDRAVLARVPASDIRAGCFEMTLTGNGYVGTVLATAFP